MLGTDKEILNGSYKKYDEYQSSENGHRKSRKSDYDDEMSSRSRSRSSRSNSMGSMNSDDSQIECESPKSDELSLNQSRSQSPKPNENDEAKLKTDMSEFSSFKHGFQPILAAAAAANKNLDLHHNATNPLLNNSLINNINPAEFHNQQQLMKFQNLSSQQLKLLNQFYNDLRSNSGQSLSLINSGAGGLAGANEFLLKHAAGNFGFLANENSFGQALNNGSSSSL